MDLDLHAATPFLVVTASIAPRTKRAELECSLVPDAEAVHQSWQATTRISPLFPVIDPSLSQESITAFPDNHWLAFIGPVRAIDVLDSCDADCHVWLTLGMFDLLVCTEKRESVDRLLHSAERQQVPYEVWRVSNGRVLETKVSSRRTTRQEWKARVARLSSLAVPQELRPALEEFCPLLASALARAEQYSSPVLEDLLNVLIEQEHDLGSVIRRASRGDGQPVDKHAVYRMIGLLGKINAGLSRFTSQAFSGTSPLISTESHYWVHSLLGTGVPNLALRNIRHFVDERLISKRLGKRFQSLVNRTEDVPSLKDLSINPGHAAWRPLYIAQGTPDDPTSNPLFPAITYYSGRDGFKSHLQTLSAPLTAISSANSKRWTLYTLTHELSHSVIRGVNTVLYPDPASSFGEETDDAKRYINEMARLATLMESTGPAANLLDEVQGAFFRTLYKMEVTTTGKPLGPKVKAQDINTLIQHWHREAEEVMTHVFDFLYFYDGDIVRYVTGIWESWSVIPNIGDRIPEYLLRTLSAALTLHLPIGKDPEADAISEVLQHLAALDSDHGGEPYVHPAKADLERNHAFYYRHLYARRGLVQLVATFLTAEDFVRDLLRETKMNIGGDSGWKPEPGRLTVESFDNPLQFIRLNTKGSPPDARLTAWMFHMLAFNQWQAD